MTENTNQPEQDAQVPEAEAPEIETETTSVAESDEATAGIDLEQEGDILTHGAHILNFECVLRRKVGQLRQFEHAARGVAHEIGRDINY